MWAIRLNGNGGMNGMERYEMLIRFSFFMIYRIDVWWRTKNPDAMLQGYKIDLQHMVGSKLPAPLLKLIYRFSFRRKVKTKQQEIVATYRCFCSPFSETADSF